MRIVIWSIVFVICSTFAVAAAHAQATSISPQIGKKTVLKGRVRHGTERLYTFDAEAGQKLVVRLISADRTSSFSVNLQDRIEYEIVAGNRRSWSGELPRSESGIYSIAVKTRKPVAAFILEITLQ